MALKVVDTAMQAFGAEGISQDTPLAQMWAQLRTLRIADVGHFSLSEIGWLILLFVQGPDAVRIGVTVRYLQLA